MIVFNNLCMQRVHAIWINLNSLPWILLSSSQWTTKNAESQCVTVKNINSISVANWSTIDVVWNVSPKHSTDARFIMFFALQIYAFHRTAFQLLIHKMDVCICISKNSTSKNAKSKAPHTQFPINVHLHKPFNCIKYAQLLCKLNIWYLIFFLLLFARH